MSEWAQLKGQARASRSLFGKKKPRPEKPGQEDADNNNANNTGSRLAGGKDDLTDLNRDSKTKTLDAAQRALNAAQNVLDTSGQAEYSVPPGQATV